jgi:starch synthase
MATRPAASRAPRARRLPARPAPNTPSALIIGSEAVPFSKTGGLADVLGALPTALARLGWDVTLALPRYRGTTGGRLVGGASIVIGGYQADVGFHEHSLGDDVRAVLIDEPSLYDRESLYAVGPADYPDNPRRFGLLVRAAFEYVIRRGVRPAVVHAHDWQAGLAPVYLKSIFASHPVLGGVPSVFTIHNMAYQGLCEPDWLPRLDLPWDMLGINRMEFWGKISFLKAGITDADMITTVSPQYAREIQTPEFGCGFDGVLRQRSADLVGILNGIDTTVWNPAHDRHIPAPFSVEDLSGKRKAKAAVLCRYGMRADLPAMGRPLVGMISRMVDQKGLDLIESIGHDLPQLGAGFVVLGTGDEKYQMFWRNLAARYPDRIGVQIGFDEGLAHLIEAGADLFLMPSRFEPCGLNQMYSLRYGTVPVVRRVGGLADTVVDFAGHGGDGSGATGFVFEPYTPEALLRTLRRALAVFESQGQWRAIQRAGMAQDHSWDRSAREYVKIYRRVATKGEVNGLG